MADGNAYRVEAWDGPTGERWVTHRDWLDAMVGPFGDAALAAADPARGESAIDVGCGGGATSIALGRAVGREGRVLGIDISAALVAAALAAARARPAEGLPVAFERGDAATAALPRGAFDILYSRFGVMFFEDPVAAFAHLRAALKPGGRLAFACWRTAAENPWVRLPLDAIRDFLPVAPPPPDAPGPFAFGSEARVGAILSAAGFADIGLRRFDHSILFGRGADRESALDHAVAMAFDVGPLSRVLAEQSPALRERAAIAVRAAFAGQVRAEGVVIDGAAWIVTARNPWKDRA